MTALRWSTPASGWTTSPSPPRLGRKWVRQTAPRLDPAETAIQQVRSLGYSPGDVQAFVADPSRSRSCRRHSGFSEREGARPSQRVRDGGVGKNPRAKERYISEQWQHGPDWAFYGEGGEDWFGFKGVRALGDREPDILMIPLPGHTPGHCGIAVRGQGQMAAARRRQLLLPRPIADAAADAAGAGDVSAQGRHGPRGAHRQPGAAADAKGKPRR